MSITVVIADDHPILLQGLSDLIESSGRFVVTETTTSGHRALACIRSHPPDIAILDLSMPVIGGMEILREIHENLRSVRAVFLTAAISPADIRSAVDLGVWGLILKDHAADELIACLNEVADGRRWLPQSILARADERGARDAARLLASLTQRETEIAHLVAQGLSNRAIAQELGSAEGTIGIHLHNIYRKLDIASRTMLAALLIRGDG